LVKIEVDQFKKIGIKNILSGRVNVDINVKLAGIDILEQSVLVTVTVFPF
jgi:FKBP-type peptidyl-prolyl cis-trans isomerase 2